MNYKMTKIHFLSNSLKVNSGFSNVTKNLAQNFEKLGYEVTISGLQTANIPEFTYGIKSYPMATNIDEMSQFKSNLMQVDPDVVIYVGEMYTDIRHLTKIFPRTIIYTPVEGLGIPDYVINDLNIIIKNGGKVIAQCKYGYDEMIKAGVKVSDYIYHGYNNKIYKELKESEFSNRYCFYNTEMGKEYVDPRFLHDYDCYNCRIHVSDQKICPVFKDELVIMCKYMDDKWTEIYNIPTYKLKEQFNNKFIYLFVGQNHLLRKRINRLLYAFSKLLETKQIKDRTHLHLHCQPQSSTGLDLLELCNRLNIQDNVSFSYGLYRSSGWSENALNILYNISDVFVSATSSEGFCLPVLESMACGIPQVTPDCTSLKELVGDNIKNIIEDITPIEKRGLLAKISDLDMIIDMTSREIVDIDDLSIKMKEIYLNKTLRESCSRNCLKFTEPYSWELISKKWDNIIKEMISK